MFSGFKRDKAEGILDLDEFRENELKRLVSEYKKIPENHIKSKNDILVSILLLQGDLETVNDASVMKYLHELKIDLIDIKRKLSELALKK